MFIIFGDKHRTETVENGLRVERACPSCNRHAVFRERVVSKQFRLYFVSMFTHGTHHVLECGECGATFVIDECPTGEARNDQAGTMLGHVQGLVDRGKELACDPALTASLERAQSEASKALGSAGEGAGKAFDAAEKAVSGWVASLKAKADGSKG